MMKIVLAPLPEGEGEGPAGAAGGRVRATLANPPRDFAGRGTSQAGGGARAKRAFFRSRKSASGPSTAYGGPPPLRKQGRI